MLTYDETIYAGNGGQNNSMSYLYNNAQGYLWWTITPGIFHYDAVYAYTVSATWENNNYIDSGGFLESYPFMLISVNSKDNYTLRPAVTLKSGITIASGNGTVSKPYIIQ